jgi:hypothetical protein
LNRKDFSGSGSLAPIDRQPMRGPAAHDFEGTMMDERNPRVSHHGIKMATKYLPKKELPSKQGGSQLSPAQLTIARQTYDSIGHLLLLTYEHWERQFTSDLFPDRPLLKWVKISKAFEAYRANHVDVTDPEKLKRVAIRLVFASNGLTFPDSSDVEIQSEFFKFDVTD